MWCATNQMTDVTRYLIFALFLHGVPEAFILRAWYFVAEFMRRMWKCVTL